MLNEERRRAIVEKLNREGRVLVTELSRIFDTSQVTIRKDLEILHSQGLIHRTHGGGLPSREGALEDPTLREKEKLHRREKLHIAAAAAAIVKEGQVVILDSGTTTTAIARALRSFQNLTIITNAVNIAAELSGTRRNGAASTAQWLAAATYSPSKRLSIDFGVAKGMNPASQDWSVFSGVVMPIAKLW